MKEFKPVSEYFSYKHFIIFNQKKYIRNEVIIPQSFCWEETPDKLEDHHVISWRAFDETEYQENGYIEYYSQQNGWAKDGHLNKSNPIPEIEKVFRFIFK